MQNREMPTVSVEEARHHIAEFLSKANHNVAILSGSLTPEIYLWDLAFKHLQNAAARCRRVEILLTEPEAEYEHWRNRGQQYAYDTFLGLIEAGKLIVKVSRFSIFPRYLVIIDDNVVWIEKEYLGEPRSADVLKGEIARGEIARVLATLFEKYKELAEPFSIQASSHLIRPDTRTLSDYTSYNPGVAHSPRPEPGVAVPPRKEEAIKPKGRHSLWTVLAGLTAVLLALIPRIPTTIVVVGDMILLCVMLVFGVRWQAALIRDERKRESEN